MSYFENRGWDEHDDRACTQHATSGKGRVKDDKRETTPEGVVRGAGEPTESCEMCGRFYEVWFTTNPVWNEAMGSVDAPGLLCPNCFIGIAAHGLEGITAWLVVPEPWDAVKRAALGLPS